MTNQSTGQRRGQPRMLKLQIIDLDTGQLKVALTLPAELVCTAQRLGARLLPPERTVDDVLDEATRCGCSQVAWLDQTSGERIQFTIE